MVQGGKKMGKEADTSAKAAEEVGGAMQGWRDRTEVLLGSLPSECLRFQPP